MITTERTQSSNDDNTLPDPDMTKIRPLGNKVIIRAVGIENKTAGGVILPESEVEDFTRRNVIGRVLAVSETAHDQKYHMSNTPWYNVGSYIAVPKVETTKMTLKNGLELIFVDYDRALCVFETIEDLDFYGYRLKR